jgi:hypothetical protein
MEIIARNNVNKCVLYFYLSDIYDNSEQESTSNTKQRWDIFVISNLFPWSAQLYIAISQVTSSSNITIFISQGPDGYMWNVVYREVLEM